MEKVVDQRKVVEQTMTSKQIAKRMTVWPDTTLVFYSIFGTFVCGCCASDSDQGAQHQ